MSIKYELHYEFTFSLDAASILYGRFGAFVPLRRPDPTFRLLHTEIVYSIDGLSRIEIHRGVDKADPILVFHLSNGGGILHTPTQIRTDYIKPFEKYERELIASRLVTVYKDGVLDQTLLEKLTH